MENRYELYERKITKHKGEIVYKTNWQLVCTYKTWKIAADRRKKLRRNKPNKNYKFKIVKIEQKNLYSI